MAGPSDIREAALKVLRQTQKQLNSPEWVLALEEADGATRREAALRLLEVQRARLRLENAQLADIRDQLAANEADLEAGRGALERALKSLDRVKAVLDSIRGFLRTLEKVLQK